MSDFRDLTVGGLRRQAGERDGGLCENCGLDCRDLLSRMKVRYVCIISVCVWETMLLIYVSRCTYVGMCV